MAQFQGRVYPPGRLRISRDSLQGPSDYDQSFIHRGVLPMKKILAFSLCALAASAALAQAFPSKPITIVVPFAAGGPTDRVARDLAEAMQKSLNGTTIEIDNAAGAGSTIGTTKVAPAKNDGYTLL